MRAQRGGDQKPKRSGGSWQKEKPKRDSCAHTHVAQGMTGRFAAKRVQGLLSEVAAEEIEHQYELMERIMQLGGEPLADPMQLFKASNAGYPAPPSDATDITGIINVVIVAERGAAINV